MPTKETKKARERALMNREQEAERGIMHLPTSSREYTRAVAEYHYVRLQLCKLRGQKINCVTINI